MDLQSGLREHPGSRASRHETGRLCQNNQKGICFMHNFRKATLAAATAAAVAFGSTAVAVAEEDTANLTPEQIAAQQAEEKAAKRAEREAKLQEKFEADKPVDYKTFFSSEDFSTNPEWAKWLFAGGIAVMVSAVIGLIIGPLYNYIVHGL